MSGLLTENLEKIVPYWVRKREALERGFKVVWTGALLADMVIHALIEGIESAWPGYGTPTSLAQSGATRDVVRGLSDTNEEYAERLRLWLDRASRRGSDEAIVRSLHDYLLGRPMVRIVDRRGHWTEIDAAGNLRTFDAPWDWDSISHPGNAAARPTDVWVIVYGAAYPKYTSWLDPTRSMTKALGHGAPSAEVDAAIVELKKAKPAHNWIRCVIWVDTPAELNPELGVGVPDGRWGNWGKDHVSGARVPARNTNFRYWEFPQ